MLDMLSSSRELPESVIKASSLREALASVLNEKSDQLARIFIIGGAQLYKAALQEADTTDRILLTQILRGHEDWECDTFFPELKPEDWRQSSTREHQDWLEGVDVPSEEMQEGGVSWRYEMWVRR